MAQSIIRVAAHTFRSLEQVEVPLGPLSVLIGPDGSGKSNLLNTLTRPSLRLAFNGTVELLTR